MMERMKFYLMNGRDAMTRICFRVKNKTGNNTTSGFFIVQKVILYLFHRPFQFVLQHIASSSIVIDT